MYFSHSSAIVALIDVRTSACLHSLRHFFVACSRRATCRWAFDSEQILVTTNLRCSATPSSLI